MKKYFTTLPIILLVPFLLLLIVGIVTYNSKVEIKDTQKINGTIIEYYKGSRG